LKSADEYVRIAKSPSSLRFMPGYVVVAMLLLPYVKRSVASYFGRISRRLRG
jgi:hypothetical protein